MNSDCQFPHGTTRGQPRCVFAARFQVGVTPTKRAEFLGCGIPCLGNSGVGDMVELLEGEMVGMALKAFDEAALISGLQALLQLAADPATGARCVGAAQKHFLLDEGVGRYAAVYQQLGVRA